MFGELANLQNSEKRENVIRCKLYREKKKLQQEDEEKRLKKLTEENESLNRREKILEKTIRILRQKYIDLVNSRHVCDSCNSDEEV